MGFLTTLLVASAGGHLRELYSLVGRLALDDDRMWVTYETEMSRSLLAGERVVWARYARPRDPVNVVGDLPAALRAVRRHRPTTAVSTGASLALVWLPIAAAHGARCHYVETATRLAGPSRSMQVLRAVPGIRLYTQTTRWTRKGVGYLGSVFDGYVSRDRPAPVDRPLRVFVTVGTNRIYGFQRLCGRLTAIVPPDTEIRWQVGEADAPHAPAGARTHMTSGEIVAAHEWADVVVAHAGVGSALTAFEAGHHPVLVPRRAAHQEHIDDHQLEIATDLRRRGLAVVAEADALALDDLFEAAGRTVRPDPDAARVTLRLR